MTTDERRSAAAAISGRGLVQKIRTMQFNTPAAVIKEGMRVPQVRGAVLAT